MKKTLNGKRFALYLLLFFVVVYLICHYFNPSLFPINNALRANIAIFIVGVPVAIIFWIVLTVYILHNKTAMIDEKTTRQDVLNIRNQGFYKTSKISLKLSKIKLLAAIIVLALVAILYFIFRK